MLRVGHDHAVSQRLARDVPQLRLQCAPAGVSVRAPAGSAPRPMYMPHHVLPTRARACRHEKGPPDTDGPGTRGGALIIDYGAILRALATAVVAWAVPRLLDWLARRIPD